MARTLSASPIDPSNPAMGDDITNFVVEGLESLRQRLKQRLAFRSGEWELDTRAGTQSVLGHTNTLDVAAGILSAAILDEGGSEVTGIESVTVRLGTDRVMRYTATVNTIYGTMTATNVAV